MADEEDLPAFCRQLRLLREAHGLTQQELAVAAGLSISSVTQMEAGKRPDPKLTTMIALAEVLGCSLDVLAGHGQGKNNKGRKK